MLEVLGLVVLVISIYSLYRFIRSGVPVQRFVDGDALTPKQEAKAKACRIAKILRQS